MRTSAVTLLVIFLASESVVPCLAAPICDGASAGCVRLVPRGKGDSVVKAAKEGATGSGAKEVLNWVKSPLYRARSGKAGSLRTSNKQLSTSLSDNARSQDGLLSLKKGDRIKSAPSQTGSKGSKSLGETKGNGGFRPKSGQEVKSAIHGGSAIPTKAPMQGVFSAEHLSNALAEVAKSKGALAGMKFLLGTLAVGGTAALVGVEIEDQQQEKEIDEQEKEIEEQEKEIEALKAEGKGKGNRESTKASSSPSQGTVSSVAASINSLTDSQVKELSDDITKATYSDDDRLTISDGVEALYNRKSITAAQRAALQGALAAGAVVGDEEADEYESQLGWVDGPGADSDGVVSDYDESRRVENAIDYLDNQALPKYEVVALIQSVKDMQLSPEHEEELVDAIESAGEKFDREEKQRNMARQQRDKAEGLVLYFSTLGVALTSDEKETFSAWIRDLFERGAINEDGAVMVLEALDKVPEEIDHSNPWYKRSGIPNLD